MRRSPRAIIIPNSLDKAVFILPIGTFRLQTYSKCSVTWSPVLVLTTIMTYKRAATFPVQPLEDVLSLCTVKGTRFYRTGRVLGIVKEAFYSLNVQVRRCQHRFCLPLAS